MEDLARLLQQAEQALLNGAIDRAISTLQKIVAAEPEEVEARLLLAEALAEKGNLPAALNLLDEGGDNVDLLLAKGDLFFEQHQTQRAAETYQRILDGDPEQADAWVSLGLVHYHQERVDQAVHCYRRALRLEPEATFALNALGDALFALGDAEAAANCFKQAIKNDPEDPHSHFNLAELYYDSGDLDRAETACRAALEQDPEFSSAYLTLGNLYMDIDRGEDALQAFLGFLQHEQDPQAADICKEVEAVVAGLREELS